MRKEVENWWRQALRDLANAEFAFGGKRYELAAFLCQQAVEKALKALFLKERRTRPPLTHALTVLGKEANVPEEFHSFLRELTPKYADTRYPNAAGDIPENLYDEVSSRRLLEETGRLFKWMRLRFPG